jgi:hypothetical protein
MLQALRANTGADLSIDKAYALDQDFEALVAVQAAMDVRMTAVSARIAASKNSLTRRYPATSGVMLVLAMTRNCHIGEIYVSYKI